VNQPSASVRVEDSGEATIYTLRFTEVENRATFCTWKFLCGEGLLLEFAVEYQYALDQPKTLAFRQKIFWVEYRGRKVPGIIQCESTIVRRKNHPAIENFGERGRYITETELHWVSVGEPLRKEPKIDLSKTMGVKSYVQDGLEKKLALVQLYPSISRRVVKTKTIL